MNVATRAPDRRRSADRFANTPCVRTRCVYGDGVNAARRRRNASGSSTSSVTPPRRGQGPRSVYRTRPSSSRESRSWENGERRPYRARRSRPARSSADHRLRRVQGEPRHPRAERRRRRWRLLVELQPRCAHRRRQCVAQRVDRLLHEPAGPHIVRGVPLHQPRQAPRDALGETLDLLLRRRRELLPPSADSSPSRRSRAPPARIASSGDRRRTP